MRWDVYLKWLGKETFVPYVNIGSTIKGFAWRTEKLNTTPLLFRNHLKFSTSMWIIMRCLVKAIAHLRGRRYSFMDRWRLPGSTSRNSATQASKVHDESPLNRSLSNPTLCGVLLSANRLSYDMATNESVRKLDVPTQVQKCYLPYSRQKCNSVANLLRFRV